MLSCKQASFLASKRLDKPLSRQEVWQMKFHTFMCGNCRHYAAEIKQLQLKIKQSAHSFISESENLSTEARKRIQKNVDKAIE